MARSPNCTGAPLYKGRVDVSISYPDPDIVTLDTPEALPTSEPATAQVSMTVGSQHLATWSPFELEHINCAILYAAGKNTSGSAVTVYYRVEKNGQSIATGSGSVPADNFYTWNHYRFPDVAAGDVLTCKLWAGASGLDWRKKALAVWPSRIGPKKQPVAGLVFYTIADRVIGYSHSPYNMFMCLEAPLSDLITIKSNALVPLICSHSAYGLAYYNVGDNTKSSLLTASSTYDLYTMSNRTLSRLSYTPLNLRV